jgi:hypothetical protein
LVGGSVRAKARDFGEVLKDIADVIAKTGDESERAAIAAEFFGRRIGPQMVPLLAQGRKGIEDFAKELAPNKLSHAEIEIGQNLYVGSASGAHSIVNLSIDGHHFNGLRASEPVANQLRQYATHRQMTSAGRRPSWVK